MGRDRRTGSRPGRAPLRLCPVLTSPARGGSPVSVCRVRSTSAAASHISCHLCFFISSAKL